jgi:hypothetical protein
MTTATAQLNQALLDVAVRGQHTHAAATPQTTKLDLRQTSILG